MSQTEGSHCSQESDRPEAMRPEVLRPVVTADQMRAIEDRIFAAGMPVPALMEKVAGLITQFLLQHYPKTQYPQVGVLVGSGHNGGDAIVVARELHLQGYQVIVCSPFSRHRDLTATHLRYVQSLGIRCILDEAQLHSCDLIVDGLFGVGISRPLEGAIADLVNTVNQFTCPIVSIDLPSGLHSDTGEVMGTAIRADRTLCLGLWKQGLLQEASLPWSGEVTLLDFGIPQTDITAVLGESLTVQRVSLPWAIAPLTQPRPRSTHKYEMGHLLLVVGSQRYAGAAILAARGAQASGAGMLSIAVPNSLKPLILSQVPDALVLGCPEHLDGSMADLCLHHPLRKYDAIACGCGLTQEATAVVRRLVDSKVRLILDADALNILGDRAAEILSQRQALTVLTPHLGEFQRMFPALPIDPCRISAVQQAAKQSGAIVLLKGARVAIADAHGQTRIIPESTAALARGGSGDVLTGLIGGLLAQPHVADANATYTAIDWVQSAAWWHAQAGIRAAQARSERGVDPMTLTTWLCPTLASLSAKPNSIAHQDGV
ncbi:MAG: NAD(P)H-hydrate dehydratase [Synechococcales bacterium]|nr:NAD(P)H-hydrate dehydratase [Synechococcales bacterium]